MNKTEKVMRKYGIKKMPIMEILEQSAHEGATKVFARIEQESWFHNEYDDSIQLSRRDFEKIKQEFRQNL